MSRLRRWQNNCTHPWDLGGAVEWTYHKTSDNAHPDGNEQQMVWLVNRARANPTQEGIWLATMTDPDVDAARTILERRSGFAPG